MSERYRIALGSIFTECNHLASGAMDISWFERLELRRQKEVLDAAGGVVGGMLACLRERSSDVVPLIVASAFPGPPLSLPCYLQLKLELLDALAHALPVDGLLLALHGAAAVVQVGDLEGDLLIALRNVIGSEIPVIATLDLHGHVTEAMIRHADALIAWETYPHRDTYQTGVRGVRMLFDILDGKVKPAMAMAKVPALVGPVNGSTEGDAPFADLMRFAKSREGQNGVLSTSVFLVHPYLDLPDMGGGGLVITDNDMERAVGLATEIAHRYWERRFDLDSAVCCPDEAISRGLQIDGGPILLVEAADCVGGGAAGDSVATLKALLESDLQQPSLVPVVDAEAALECHRMGIGAEITVKLGHKLDPQWGQPLTVSGKIEKLSDGRFQYDGGIWEGQWGNMGPSVMLRIGAIEVLISSLGTYDWMDEQFHSFQADTRSAKFIVVKNPMNFRLAYAGISKGFFILDTPGPTPATLHHVGYKQMQRPYYPADKEIPQLRPKVFQHDS